MNFKRIIEFLGLLTPTGECNFPKNQSFRVGRFVGRLLGRYTSMLISEHLFIASRRRDTDELNNTIQEKRKKENILTKNRYTKNLSSREL